LARAGSSGAPDGSARTELLLTDQEEAMANLRENVATNLALLTGGASECDGVRIEASQMGWGCDEDHASLAIQPAPRPFDLIIASDVVFNPIYFEPLLDSLDYISSTPPDAPAAAAEATDAAAGAAAASASRPTEVLMAYRPRASDKKQDEVFFRALPGRGWSVRKEARYNDVFMLTLTRTHRATNGSAGMAAAKGSKSVLSPSPSPSQSPPLAQSAKSSVVATSASSSAAPATVAPAQASSAASSSLPGTAATPSAEHPAASSPAAASSVSIDGDATDDAAAASSASPSAVAPAVAADLLSGVLETYFADVATGEEQGQRDGLLQSRYPSAYTARVWARVDRARTSLSALPLVASGMDPMQLDEGDSIVQLRSQFKLLLAQMGFQQYFKTEQAEERQTISF